MTEGGGGKRVLIVAQDFPWPATIGSHLRLAQVIEAAGEVGEVDLFSLVPARRSEPCNIPHEVRVRRFATVTRPVPQWSPGRRAAWALSSKLPLEVAEANDPRLAKELLSWAESSYDAVWFSKAATFELLGRPHFGPTVVDLDDLEDRKIRSRIEAMRDGSGERATPFLRREAATVQARLNAHRWSRLQASVAEAVERVVLCSELDAERAGLPNSTVVRNGYREPITPLGRVDSGDPPTAMFAGSYCYGPNADAAHWLVSNIWPLVLAARPGAALRLVGEPDDSVQRLESPPSVTVVGRVDSMEPELARADLVVVPLRYGSGTRLKILEAFAQRIPVVSTTLGAEGLGAEAGVHLLVSDDAAGFASACIRLFEDVELRERLVDNAQRLFLEQFRWTSASEHVRALLEEIGSR